MFAGARRAFASVSLAVVAVGALTVIAQPVPDTPAAAPATSQTPAVVPVPAGRASSLPRDITGELIAQRTADSDTYVTTEGQRYVVEYPAPVNYKDGAGAFQPIDDTANQDSNGWHNAAGLYAGAVPTSLNGKDVSVAGGGDSVSLVLLGSQVDQAAARVVPGASTGIASADRVSFASALPQTDLKYQFLNTGLKETLSLHNAASPTVFTWTVSASSGLTAQASGDDSIRFVDSSGAVKMIIPRPTISDANHLSGPTPSLTLSPDGHTLTLSLAPDASWLATSSRTFPVAVDPSVFYEGSSSGQNAECELIQNEPNSPECQSATDYDIGYNAFGGQVNSLFRFSGLTSDIPYDSLIQYANVQFYEDNATTTTPVAVSINTVANNLPWSGTTATWNDYDGVNAWPVAGGSGSPDDQPTPLTSTLNLGTGNGWFSWQPVDQLQEWVNGADLTTQGSPASVNQGFLLTTGSQVNCVSIANWQSSSSNLWPSLSVTYVPRRGTDAPLDVLKTSINDKTTLGVNVANGNLTVDTSDFNITGVGPAATVAHVYNSLGGTASSLGSYSGGSGSWSVSPSGDQPFLQVQANNPPVIDLDAQDGTIGAYIGTQFGWAQPSGIDTTLAQIAGGYQVQFHGSNEVWTFHQDPANSSVYLLATDTDRNGNALTYTYNSSGQLTQLQDTLGRDVVYSYNGSGYLSSITDSTNRSLTFGYTGSELTSVQFGGATTSFAYDSNGNLNKVTDPIGNITTMAYDSSHRVTAVTRVTNSVNLTGPTTTYTYTPSNAAHPATMGSTAVQDPNSHTTTYQWDQWDRVNKVTDANGNQEQSGYNPNSDVTQLTDALTNQTTMQFDNNNNLTQITAPASSGNSAATEKLAYNTPSSTTGAAYLPSTSIDPQTNCTTYTYDAAGNLASTIAGQGSGCSGSGATTSTNTYQDAGKTICSPARPGELCKVTDGNNHVTTYGYDSNGQLTSITPPSPEGATTITYDSLTRPHTVTTPDGTATYTYDAWDRTTQVAYASGPTVSYTYDADGNLKSRTDPSGTTSFTYDALNRMITEALPGAADACPGVLGSTINLGYDAASNLVSFCDAMGTTAYGYDNANRMTSLAEPGGSCTSSPASLCTTFAYNANNKPTTTTFPGGATLTIGYDPKTQDETSVVGRAAPIGTGSVLTSYQYSYAAGTSDTELRQSMIEADPVANVTTSYSYDAMNRLISASNSSTTLNYAYDAVGNRCADATSCANPTYAYNSDNELTSGPGGNYNYNSGGDMTSSPAYSSLAYNTAGQTTSVTPTGGSANALAYADRGQEQLVTDGSRTIVNGPLGVDSSTSGTSETFFIHDPSGNVIGQRTDTVVNGSIVASGSTQYFLKDALGSVTAVISSDGSTVSDRYNYDPYGKMTVLSGSDYEPWRYAGGYYDGLGFYKFGQRYYQPSNGSWTQADTIAGAASGVSSDYAYSADDPINMSDASGESPTRCCHYWNYSVPQVHRSSADEEFGTCHEGRDGERIVGSDGKTYECQHTEHVGWAWLPVDESWGPDEPLPPEPPGGW